MKISAVITLLGVAYVAGAVKTGSTAHRTNNVAAGSGASMPVGVIHNLNFGTEVAGSLPTVTAGVSSHTNRVATTVNHGVTPHQASGTEIFTRVPDGASGPYSRGGHPRYVPGVFPGSHGGAYHSNRRWAYPGQSAGVYPGFLRPLYPGLVKVYLQRLLGGAYSRFVREVYPGLMRRVYGSLYGLRQVPFPASHSLPSTAPGIAQLPVVRQLFPKPGSLSTNIGSAATVSQGQVVTPVVSGPGQQQNVVQEQTPARLGRLRPE